MGVVNLKSDLITARDATPRTPVPAAREGGYVKHWVATVEVATSDTSTSTYRMGVVPSNALISSLKIFSDDMGSLTTIDFGIYDTEANGGASISQACYASAIDTHSGALNGTDITYEARDIANCAQRVWEVLGLSADPCKDYDLVANLVTSADVGGTLTLHCAYVL